MHSISLAKSGRYEAGAWTGELDQLLEANAACGSRERLCADSLIVLNQPSFTCPTTPIETDIPLFERLRASIPSSVQHCLDHFHHPLNLVQLVGIETLE